MTADLTYVVAGASLLLAIILPDLLDRWAISAPMVLVGVGMLIGLTPLPDGMPLDPQEHQAVILHVTELAVLVALMGVGLALDRPLDFRDLRSWGRWSPAWRLLAVTMPLSIAGVALLGWWAAGLAPAAALLLGAALAPTDPVLASDVQVGGPDVSAPSGEFEVEEPGDETEESDEVRFALTAEAGLNDGLAFPFVHLALLTAAGLTLGDVGLWAGWYVVGKVVVGTAVGIVVGFLMGRIVFRAQRQAVRLAAQSDPLVALAALLTTYGLAEVVGGYGFLSVFACGMTLRSAERRHDYHRDMHDVVERLERLLTLVVLLFLGIATTRGLFEHLDLAGVLVGCALVLVIRPVTGWLALAVRPREGRGGLCREERLAVAFFGVRGVGSLYYLAYAATHADVPEEPWLWSTVAFTIVLSVLVHGVTATPAMAWLDRRREEVAPAGR